MPKGAFLTLLLLCPLAGAAQAPAQDAAAAPAAAAAAAPGPSADDSPPLRVGGNIRPPHALLHEMPQPTPEAAEHRIGGSVTLAFVVERDGSTSHIRVVRGIGYGLDEAAVDAITRWKFAPATDGEQPVRVEANATVHFTPR